MDDGVLFRLLSDIVSVLGPEFLYYRNTVSHTNFLKSSVAIITQTHGRRMLTFDMRYPT